MRLGTTAPLGFNTFWTFSADNPFTGGIYTPEIAEVCQILTFSYSSSEFSACPNKQLDQSDSPSNAFY
jgi:hypothetical protein